MNEIKQLYHWLCKEGGLLHFLACYAITLTFAPLGIIWASAITWSIAIGKEAYDLIKGTNNLKNVANDIIRDAIGWGCGVIVAMIL